MGYMSSEPVPMVEVGQAEGGRRRRLSVRHQKLLGSTLIAAIFLGGAIAYSKRGVEGTALPKAEIVAMFAQEQELDQQFMGLAGAIERAYNMVPQGWRKSGLAEGGYRENDAKFYGVHTIVPLDLVMLLDPPRHSAPMGRRQGFYDLEITKAFGSDETQEIAITTGVQSKESAVCTPVYMFSWQRAQNGDGWYFSVLGYASANKPWNHRFGELNPLWDEVDAVKFAALVKQATEQVHSAAIGETLHYPAPM